jgi:hypothetical protein
MIVTYVPTTVRVDGPWFPGREDILSSLALVPTDQRPGRVYFAPPKKVRPPEILASLATSHPGYRFELIHPKPRKHR